MKSMKQCIRIYLAILYKTRLQMKIHCSKTKDMAFISKQRTFLSAEQRYAFFDFIFFLYLCRVLESYIFLSLFVMCKWVEIVFGIYCYFKWINKSFGSWLDFEYEWIMYGMFLKGVMLWANKRRTGCNGVVVCAYIWKRRSERFE